MSSNARWCRGHAVLDVLRWSVSDVSYTRPPATMPLALRPVWLEQQGPTTFAAARQRTARGRLSQEDRGNGFTSLVQASPNGGLGTPQKRSNRSPRKPLHVEQLERCSQYRR